MTEASSPATGAGADRPDRSPRWFACLAVCVAYLATTTGESLLAPIYPVAAPELGLDLAGAGVAFFTLAFSIATANIVGGVLLRSMTANRVLALALAATAAGGTVAATAQGSAQFLGAQVLLGSGAGLLYPAAIMSVGVFAGDNRRGFAMAVFGVFFSGGLTLAAILATVGSNIDWRLSFLIGSVLAVMAGLGVWPIADSPRSEQDSPLFAGLRAVLGAPTAVGVVGGISQYATVSFFPVFAVTVWELTESRAALALAVGRVLSIPAKLVSGALADKAGPIQAARANGLALAAVGAVWSLSPNVPLAVAGAVAFTAAVSGLFPLANLLAFKRVGRKGGALGAFRSLQLGAGAVAGFLVGLAAEAAGLRPTVAVVTLLPLVLVALRRVEVQPESRCSEQQLESGDAPSDVP